MAATLGAMASCRDPTEVTLVLTTDVPCSGLKETAIVVGSAADVETKSPVAVTSSCDPTGSGDHTIGTFVVIPDSGGSSSPFAVRVVSAVDKMTTADCTPADDYSGCIVARRELSFVPHTPLTLPIVIRLDCLDVACAPGETCVHGTCKSDQVPQCASACGESALPPVDAGATPSGDGAAPEGATTVGEPGSDASSTDATSKDGSEPDATLSDAGGAGDAHPPADAGAPGDATVLGPCVSSAANAGVACAPGACAQGQVCCIAEPSGAASTESCTAPGACDVNGNGNNVRYSPLACRSVGDCPSGTVCCLEPSTVTGGGVATVCTAASACNGVTYRPACQNTCECPSPLTCMTASCSGFPVGLCGTTICY